MKKVFRSKNNSQYWDDRWAANGVDNSQFNNLDIYPIKYAELVTPDSKKILEAGCGAGRLYFHYRKENKDIEGIEYSKIAVDNILAKEPDAKVVQGSVTDMPYEDGHFDSCLAFGLYHNLEDETDLQKSFSETSRVLSSGGRLVASVRCDNIENKLLEWFKNKNVTKEECKHFHKWQFNLKDLTAILNKYNLKVQKAYYARNVSFLFQIDCFRSQKLKKKNFKESEARSSGFELNFIGKIIDKFLHKVFPGSFSNLIVIVAEKE